MVVGDGFRDLLAWQIDAGADEAIADAPIDRFALAEQQPPPLAPPVVASKPSAGLGQGVSASPRKIAQATSSIAELRAAFEGFEGCPLKDTATNFVFADGTPGAPLMFIGEAPGAEEDRRGLPFVGPAGRLLNRMLAAIGMARDQAYITNILPWRPPGNRNPTDSEIAACLPFIERHIALANPQILVAVGGTAAKALLNTRDGIMRLRGRWFNHNVPDLASPIPLRAVLHPAYLLRQPAQKGEAWHDLVEIKKALGEARTSQ